MDDVALEDPVAGVAPTETGAARCSCGSGLPAAACCSLDLRGLGPGEPTPENKVRLEDLAEARRIADLQAATELSLAALTEQPTLLDALAQLYLIRKDQDLPDAAMALIRRAATLAPTEARYGLYLAVELIAAKAWREA